MTNRHSGEFFWIRQGPPTFTIFFYHSSGFFATFRRHSSFFGINLKFNCHICVPYFHPIPFKPTITPVRVLTSNPLPLNFPLFFPLWLILFSFAIMTDQGNRHYDGLAGVARLRPGHTGLAPLGIPSPSPAFHPPPNINLSKKCMKCMSYANTCSNNGWNAFGYNAHLIIIPCFNSHDLPAMIRKL